MMMNEDDDDMINDDDDWTMVVLQERVNSDEKGRENVKPVKTKWGKK